LHEILIFEREFNNLVEYETLIIPAFESRILERDCYLDKT
jgi:hypothetical protein